MRLASTQLNSLGRSLIHPPPPCTVAGCWADLGRLAGLGCYQSCECPIIRFSSHQVNLALRQEGLACVGPQSLIPDSLRAAG